MKGRLNASDPQVGCCSEPRIYVFVDHVVKGTVARATAPDHIMETDDYPTNRPDAEILMELTNRVQADLPLLAEHLRIWLEAHRTHPRELSASSDPEGTRKVRLWLVTDHIGDSDASSRVVYDAAQRMFGLVTELQSGVLWYMGPYGSLVDTVQSI